MYVSIYIYIYVYIYTHNKHDNNNKHTINIYISYRIQVLQGPMRRPEEEALPEDADTEGGLYAALDLHFVAFSLLSCYYHYLLIVIVILVA